MNLPSLELASQHSIPGIPYSSNAEMWDYFCASVYMSTRTISTVNQRKIRGDIHTHVAMQNVSLAFCFRLIHPPAVETSTMAIKNKSWKSVSCLIFQ